ncbi:hypothetical protein Tco_0946047 [Tanacetum coccineum]
MLDHSKAEPMGILKDVLWQVGVTTIIAKILILDIHVDQDVLIVVGRSFLYTCGSILNTVKGTTSTFDGICHQKFYVAKVRNNHGESDSDDEEEYYLKRDENGKPFYGPNHAKLLPDDLQAYENACGGILTGLLKHGDYPNKTKHLLALDGAKEIPQLFQANLLKAGLFDVVIEGCDGVLHTASPFFIPTDNLFAFPNDEGSGGFGATKETKAAGLKAQVDSWNPDYEVIHLIRRETSSVMEVIPESLRVDVEAQVSSQYEEVKNLFLTPINDSQQEKIEREIKKMRHSESTINPVTSTLSRMFVLMNPLS